MGKNCSIGGPYVLFVFWLFVILVISRFSFEGGLWFLIATVHGHCILVTCDTDSPDGEIWLFNIYIVEQ